MEEIKISIIMGVYNAEKTIRDCIESIQNQTYGNWEFIICDDCSTDRTSDIVKMYARNDSRIVYIKNEENLRLAASLNHCLEYAKGKYIARMDADDISLPQRLGKQVAYLEENPDIDLVGSNMIVFDDRGDYGLRKVKNNPTKEDIVKGNVFCHPTIMMKKSVYDELGGYTVNSNTMRAEDLDLWFRFLASNHKGYNFTEPLHKYRENESDLKKRSFSAAIRTCKVYFNGYKIIKTPIIKRVWGFKPIIVALIPNSILNIYYKKRLG